MGIRRSTAALVFALAGLGAWPGTRGLDAEGPDRETLYRNAELLAEVTAWILDRHVDAPDADALFRAAIRGMAESLDGYSTLLSPAELAALEAGSHGPFGGIGVVLSAEGGALTLLAVEEGSPAWEGGLRPGDRILAVGDVSARGLHADRAAALLRGAPGTELCLKVEGGMGENGRTVTLRRAMIRGGTVGAGRSLGPDGAVGCVRVLAFERSTAEELAAAVERLRASGCRGLVLDLRDAPGGILEAAVDCAALFAPAGAALVETEARGGRLDAAYRAPAAGPFAGFPLAVLTSGGTASAAEALAGALRSAAGAALVGGPTYGKRAVQEVFLLEGGSGLKLSTARFRFPGEDRAPRGEDGRLAPDVPAGEGPGAAEEAARTWLMRRME